jgi:hypothetical protein
VWSHSSRIDGKGGGPQDWLIGSSTLHSSISPTLSKRAFPGTSERTTHKYLLNMTLLAAAVGLLALWNGVFSVSSYAVEQGRSQLPFVLADRGAKSGSVETFIANVSVDSLRRTARYLTGEDPSSPIATRQAYSKDGYQAALWLQDQFVSLGFNVSFDYFVPRSWQDEGEDGAVVNWNPNVVAEMRGAEEPDKIIVLGAHYDDRQTNVRSTTDRAPGANDDGSGSSMLVEVAKLISQWRAKRGGQDVFRYTVRLIAFSGEEEGLYGSSHYAKAAKLRKDNILAMFQGDMIAYRKPGTKVAVAFVKDHTSSELTVLAKSITAQYVPELEIQGTVSQSDGACDDRSPKPFELTAVAFCAFVNLDSRACCSDQQPFYSQGYPSVGFVEPGGYLIDPQYHKVGDVTERAGYDFEQLAAITKSVAACVAVLGQLLD